MNCRLCLAITALAACASVASAEGHLTLTLEDTPDVCPDRPPEPLWMQNIEVREAHNRLLVQQIYRAQSMRRILEAKKCACSTRYPPWNAAQAVYFERYSGAEYWDVVEATSEYRREANALRLKAMPRKTGNEEAGQ